MRTWIKDVHGFAMKVREVPAPIRYCVTIGLIAIVTVVQVRWGATLQRYPFLIYIPIIFGCAALLDRGNGFLSTTLATAACAYYLLPPLYSFDVADTVDRVALGIFFTIGIAISLILEALHVTLVDLAVDHELLGQAARRFRQTCFGMLSCSH